MHRPHLALAAPAAALTLLLAACGGGDAPAPAPPSVAILTPDLELAAGDTAPLAAVVLPDPGASQAVTWSSADTAVARVALGGGAWSVRGVASGTTTLTATSVEDPARSATTTVTVFRPPTLAFPAGALLLDPAGPLDGSADLVNSGERAATGLALVVTYPLGTGGWLTATLPGAGPHQLAAGGAVAVTFAADPDAVAALPPGLHAATVDVTADFGVVTAGNPLTLLLSVP